MGSIRPNRPIIWSRTYSVCCRIFGTRRGRSPGGARCRCDGARDPTILIFRPDHVDIARSPLWHSILEATNVMGAFNTGLAPLPNGNVLLMVGVAEALKEPNQMYLPTPVVFATGVADAGDHYIVASREADLACRITHTPKALFA